MKREESNRAWAEFSEAVLREINADICLRKAIEGRLVEEIELHLIINQRPDLIAKIPDNGHYNMGGHLIRVF